MDAREYMDCEFPWNAIGPTDLEYLRRARMLVIEFADAADELWSKDIQGFVEYLVDRAATLSRNSWRLYRAALTTWLAPRAPAWFTDRLQAIEADVGGNASAASNHKRMKKLPEKDFIRMMEAANEPDKWTWLKVAGIWLSIGSVTGLRPCEWWGARIEGDWLIVNNSKYTVDRTDTRSARAFGPERHIDIGALPAEERKAIDVFLSNVVQRYEAEAARKCAMQALRRLRRRLWPKRDPGFHLYSARHQFVADLKKANFSRITIAALLGHASLHTAEQHYGRRQAGRGGAGTLVAPAAEDVAKVEALQMDLAAEANDDAPSLS